MSDLAHTKACYEARLRQLKQFFAARGHSEDEATVLCEKHLRGETVAINPVPETIEAT